MFENLLLACKSYSEKDKERKKQFSNRYIDADVDASMNSMLDAFLESAPQLVLQLCILEVNGWSQNTWEIGKAGR